MCAGEQWDLRGIPHAPEQRRLRRRARRPCGRARTVDERGAEMTRRWGKDAPLVADALGDGRRTALPTTSGHALESRSHLLWEPRSAVDPPVPLSSTSKLALFGRFSLSLHPVTPHPQPIPRPRRTRTSRRDPRRIFRIRPRKPAGSRHAESPEPIGGRATAQRDVARRLMLRSALPRRRRSARAQRTASATAPAAIPAPI